MPTRSPNRAAAIAHRLSRRLTFPVASLDDALAQLGTDETGVRLAGGGTLDAQSKLRDDLQAKYFPLKSEADLAKALAGEMPNYRPVGNWARTRHGN